MSDVVTIKFVGDDVIMSREDYNKQQAQWDKALSDALSAESSLQQIKDENENQARTINGLWENIAKIEIQKDILNQEVDRLAREYDKLNTYTESIKKIASELEKEVRLSFPYCEKYKQNGLKSLLTRCEAAINKENKV
jgi:archaellum component FlaC